MILTVIMSVTNSTHTQLTAVTAPPPPPSEHTDDTPIAPAETTDAPTTHSPDLSVTTIPDSTLYLDAAYTGDILHQPIQPLHQQLLTQPILTFSPAKLEFINKPSIRPSLPADRM